MNQNTLFNYLILLLFFTISVRSQTITSETVSKGINLKQIENPADTLIIYLLAVNLDSCDCHLNTIKAGGRLSGLDETSDIAADPDVIAAVNADFFKTDGSVINNLISDGKIIKAVSEPSYNSRSLTYSQFCLDEENNPHIEKFIFSGKVKIHDKVEDIYGINVPFTYGENILYNNHADIPDTAGRFFLLTYLDDKSEKSTYRVSGEYYSVPENLKQNDFLLFSNSRFGNSDSIELILNFKPDHGRIKMLTGGWPAIVKNGINITGDSEVLEGTSPNFALKRHPRTGIGFNSDSSVVYFFAVDGRQKRSRGMSLDEFADLMISEGVYYGLNLDGGGSTTMLINGKVINNPSDLTGERKVGNAIIIKKNNYQDLK